MSDTGCDDETLKALKAGDEGAFRDLVSAHHQAMVRLAKSYVSSEAVAEEVAQDTWMAVLRGLDGFEGRSSLKTWIFSVLVNRARSRWRSELRSLPLSELTGEQDRGRTVDPERFLGPGDPFEGAWRKPPVRVSSIPEEHVLNDEIRRVVDEEISKLPLLQQQVVTLRDVQGWPSQDICAVLGLTDNNQRVLLHRGRSRLRAQLESRLEEKTQ
ncbi:MAG: RNA polymerase sigma factor [Acidimicrobiales bacterium]